MVVPLACSYIRKHRKGLLLLVLVLTLLILISTTCFPSTWSSSSAEFDDSNTVLVRGGGRSISSNVALPDNMQFNSEGDRNKRTATTVRFSLTNYSDPMIGLSRNTNQVLREKFQRKRVHRFCTRHKRQMRYFVFPAKNKERQLLFEHLLFNDKHRTIFCHVEQIQCSSKTAVTFVSHQNVSKMDDEGKIDDTLIPKAQISTDGTTNLRLNNNNFDGITRRFSFANNTLNSISRRKRMKDYYKTMIVMNPLERLLSSYIQLIQSKSLTHLHVNDTFPYSTIIRVLQKTRSKEYREWKTSGAKYPLEVSFEEFVEYFIETPFHEISLHFRPMTHLCHPCRIHYDFYGNDKLCTSDYHSILQRNTVHKEEEKQIKNTDNDDNTERLLFKYYRNLPQRLTSGLVTKLYIDLDFYYHLYPEERQSHKLLLNI